MAKQVKPVNRTLAEMREFVAPPGTPAAPGKTRPARKSGIKLWASTREGQKELEERKWHRYTDSSNRKRP